MNLYQHELFLEDLRYVASLSLPWDRLRNRKIMLSGATGLIGSFLVDVIREKNRSEGLNCMVFILGRDETKARERFQMDDDSENLVFVPYDISKPIKCDGVQTIDYVLHLASHTHPIQYASDPIGTIMVNIIGLQNMLNFAVEHNVTRFAFASSNEIYGENRGDVEFFKEEYCGYINCNTMRAGYPESKRCGEALCQAYKEQKGIDIIIPRFTRSFGPTMLLSDSKAISQFIKKAICDEDIVLKSEGNQFYSYTYVADAVSGLLTILLCCENGQAYNIADPKSDILLKDLAQIIAEFVGKKVVFEIPDSLESAGYSVATKARLDASKLKGLGWTSRYTMEDGVKRTIRIIKDIYTMN